MSLVGVVVGTLHIFLVYAVGIVHAMAVPKADLPRDDLEGSTDALRFLSHVPETMAVAGIIVGKTDTVVSN